MGCRGRGSVGGDDGGVAAVPGGLRGQRHHRRGPSESAGGQRAQGRPRHLRLRPPRTAPQVHTRAAGYPRIASAGFSIHGVAVNVAGNAGLWIRFGRGCGDVVCVGTSDSRYGDRNRGKAIIDSNLDATLAIVVGSSVSIGVVQQQRCIH